ncbi:MAG: prephenate dehydrogenase [Bacteroidota bacterium]
MVISIVGIGLIGGSLALDLRANGFASKLIGVDQHPEHCKTALDLGLVDEILPLEDACKNADLVVLAIPVGAIISLFPRVLSLIPSRGVVVDMGSTKGEISSCIAEHPWRRRAVIAHPMAGTEYSGPKAAVPHLFHGKAAIICEAEKSEADAIYLVERLFKSLFMRVLHMDAKDHDIHAAYVSHISHISSFVLALTVLDKEKSETNIFNLASGGFESTVRLAKSSPRMWRDVYEQNTSNILDVLDIYIEKMTHFRNDIQAGNFEATFERMKEANEIGRILKGISQKSLQS